MPPFVEIKVENNGCMSGWDPVFFKEWAGIEYKCLSWSSGKSRHCTSSIKAIPPI